MAPVVKRVAHSLSQDLKVQLRTPRPFSEWKPVLLDIQVLYLKKEYKQCMARCEQLISGIESRVHPVHTVFLHFYAAVCLELLAESAHPLSANKLPLLEQAKQHYLHAGSLLPWPVVVSSPPSTPRSSMSFESTSSEETVTPRTTPDISPDPRGEGDRGDEDPATPTSRSSSAAFLTPSPMSSEGLRPSPLRVHKLIRYSSSSSSLSIPYEPDFEPAPLDPFTSPATPAPVFQTPFINDAATTNLQDLTTQISTHLSTLNTPITRANQDQTARRVTRFADLRNARFDEDVRALDRQARIERARKYGWNRPRFEPGRYQELARRAMAEL